MMQTEYEIHNIIHLLDAIIESMDEEQRKRFDENLYRMKAAGSLLDMPEMLPDDASTRDIGQ